MSSSDTSGKRGSEPHNHAEQMSHTGLVQPPSPATRKCDIRRLCGALSGDLTFASIAGSMDDHEADEKGVFAR